MTPSAKPMTPPSSARTFRAPDARSALAAVKEAFGADAIIVSTRQVPGGLFRKAMVEVTAAPAASPAAPATPRSVAWTSELGASLPQQASGGIPRAYSSRPPVTPGLTVSPATSRGRPSALAATLTPASLATANNPLAHIPTGDRRGALPLAPVVRPPLADLTGATEAQPILDAPALSPFRTNPPHWSEEDEGPIDAGPTSSSGEPAANRSSIAARPDAGPSPGAPVGGAMAGTIWTGAGQMTPRPQRPEAVADSPLRIEEPVEFGDRGPSRRGRHWRKGGAADNLARRYEDNGVEASVAVEWIGKALATGAQEEADLDSVVRHQVSVHLRTAPAPWERASGRQVVSLIGPTGVGKTTTLAKIAARAILSNKTRVALITTDTYRICASDQLARYGQIMRTPTFVARDAQQLTAAISQTSNYDLVLVDTAGRAIQADLERQVEMLRIAGALQMYLTLSLASGPRELAANCRRYGQLVPSRVILTKTDESVAPGAALAPLLELGLPITCITNGQEVPEDVRPVTPDELAALFLGPPPLVRTATSVTGGGRVS